ncbi:sensor histidine kinase, partial [Streptosporangium algeriense]
MVTKGAWSVRTRLTLIAVTVAALSGLALTLVATVSLYGLASSFRAQEITNAALETINLTARERLPAVLPRGTLDGVQVLDPSGRVLSATPNLSGRPRMADFVPPAGEVSTDRQVCGGTDFPDRCMVVVAFRVHRADGDWIIYAADDVVPWYVHPGLFAVIFGTSVTLVLLAGVGAYQTVNRTLAPVDSIRGELAEITATDLGRRVPVPPDSGEIKQLAITINQTLDRLEAAAEQQRRFASDASHDLRSPLTAMRAQVEEALHYPEDTDWKAKAGEMLASLDRLQAIVSDLLMLARLDSGAPMARQPIDLGELCREEMTHRRRGVEMTCHAEPGVVVQGSRLRLARLLT